MEQIIGFSSSIAANLATDILKYGAGLLLEKTELGRRIKVAIDPEYTKLEDQFKLLLAEAFIIYFTKRFPDRQFQGIYDFFKSETVSKAIFDSVFNFAEIDRRRLVENLESEIGNDWILIRILESKNISLRDLIDDFLICYYDVEKSSIGIPGLVIIREIKFSERRIIESTNNKIEEVGDKIILSIVDDLNKKICELSEQIEGLGDSEEQKRIFNFIEKDMALLQRVTHDYAARFNLLFGYSENLVRLVSKSTNGENDRLLISASSLRNEIRSAYNLLQTVFLRIDSIQVRMEVTRLHPMLQTAIDINSNLIRTKQLKLDITHIGDDLPPLKLSRRHIELALSNILYWVAKYSLDDTKIEVKAILDGSFCKISFFCFGFALLPEEQKKIFESGYIPIHSKGNIVTGVGRELYVAQRIIEAHEGRIIANNRKVNDIYSTTFDIFLPQEKEK